MHIILPRYRLHLTLLWSLVFICSITSCSLFPSQWTSTQDVVDAFHKNGFPIDHVTKEVQPALTELNATSISFSIVTPSHREPSGSIIVFANEQQARLFSAADSYYRQYPEAARYRVVRNRNAVLLVKEEIPIDEASPVLEMFQAIAP